jgi:hypothetical protein
MRSHAFIAIALGTVFAAAACSSADDGGSSEEDATGAKTCVVVDAQSGGTADLSKDDSPFAKLVLANKSLAKCPLTFTDALNTLKSKIPHPERQIAFGVDETANDLSATDHRFVLSIDTGDAPVIGNGTGSAGDNTTRVWMAALEGKPDSTGAHQLDEGFIEVIAFSQTKQANVFYKFFDGKWHLMGDGTQANPATSPDDQKFFCRNCHATGALNFKELELPWNNWNSARFKMPKPAKVSGTMNDLMGKLGDAYELEKMIEAANITLVAGRVKAVLAGQRKDESFKTLVREVMCEVGEPTLASSQAAMQKNALDNDDASSIFLPAEMFEVFDRGTRGTVSIPRQAYKDAIANAKQTVGGAAGDTMFAFFIPERSFVDDRVTDQLVTQGVLDDDAVTDLRMTDFTNPVFSAQRCALADTIPDDAKNADDLRKDWVPILSKSNLPGASGLAARLGTKNDQDAARKRVDAYVAKCVARGADKNDAPKFVDELVHLASQRRQAFVKAFPAIDESPALIPKDKLGVSEDSLHMHEDCTVQASESEIE